MTAAVVASMLVNVGTVLSVSAMTVAASASFIAAGFTGFGVLANFVKVLFPSAPKALLAKHKLRRCFACSMSLNWCWEDRGDSASPTHAYVLCKPQGCHCV